MQHTLSESNEFPQDNEIQPEKKSRLKQLYTKAQQIYMNHPAINLSSLTGWRYPSIPRLLGNPFLGRLPHMWKGDGILQNLIDAGKVAAKDPSGICYYWLINQVAVLVTKPEQIKQVFISNNLDVSRRSAAKFMESFWGSSITTDPYELWKKKRAVYSNHLATPKALNENQPWMQAIIDKNLRNIKANEKNIINLRELLSNYTLEMILSLMIPYEESRDITKFANYTAFVGDNAANLKNIFKWSLPTFIRKLLFRDKAQVQKKMKCIFSELLLTPNKDNIKNTNNFIRSIWELRKSEPGQEALESNTDVFGDSNAMFFAAQDTVTSTLEFAFKLLCANPDIEEKLRTQLKTHLQEQEFTLENIEKVEYLEMIIKEVLRLYPPAPMVARGVDKNFKIGNLPLFKKSLIIISPYITHHLSDLWENPLQFNPERFSKENITKIPPHAYIPFGEGPHGCVGWRFAFQQIKLLLAAIYMNYHVEVEDNNFQITIFRTTIRPKNNTKARLIRLN